MRFKMMLQTYNLHGCIYNNLREYGRKRDLQNLAYLPLRPPSGSNEKLCELIKESNDAIFVPREGCLAVLEAIWLRYFAEN